jgi:uncharacterized membrane protein
MPKRVMVISLVGALLLGWSGASVSNAIGLSGIHRADLALFAIGIVCFVLGPLSTLSQRLVRLERQLAERLDGHDAA